LAQIERDDVGIDDAILLIDRAYDRLRDATLARVEVQRKAAKAALREAAAMARIV